MFDVPCCHSWGSTNPGPLSVGSGFPFPASARTSFTGMTKLDLLEEIRNQRVNFPSVEHYVYGQSHLRSRGLIGTPRTLNDPLFAHPDGIQWHEVFAGIWNKSFERALEHKHFLGVEDGNPRQLLCQDLLDPLVVGESFRLVVA